MASSTADPLSTAINQFRACLKPEQRAELLLHSSKPDGNSILVFTAEIDKLNADRRSRCVSSRLFGILQSVKEFSDVADTFVSSHPEIAALVWGSLKFTIIMANNVLSFFDKLSEVLLRLRECYPRYAEYQILFADYPRLQKVLCGFYASVVNFCAKAIRHIQDPGSSLVQALWNPFEKEFKEFEVDLRNQNKAVAAEIKLAAEQAAAKEREAASTYRESGSSFRNQMKKTNKASQEWRLRRDQQKARAERERLLQTLSSFDYISALKRFRKKRHGSTGSWLSQTPAFREWIQDKRSSALWLSGFVGSGKSVVTAAAVDDILLKPRSPKDHVSFFFCEFDNVESLKAVTILGCLIRQCLSADALSPAVEDQLKELYHHTSPDADDLKSLLFAIVEGSKSSTFIIDGFDECPEDHRTTILKILGQLLSEPTFSIKILISSREDTIKYISRFFTNCVEVTMNCKEANGDIPQYVKDTVAEKLKDGDLVISNSQLIEDIQKALIKGANGMFLWVTFQLQDLCRQTCDADIRQTLSTFPRDLPETYHRVLLRIIQKGKEDIVQRIFQWVAVARRPLLLGELREALAIRTGDKFLHRDRLLNDPDGIVDWCAALVSLDEEDLLVQFAHHSVKQFLLSQPFDTSTQQFHFQTSQADLMVGEVCVAYLNFNDFERQVIRASKQLPTFQPNDIADAAIAASQSRLSKRLLHLARATKLRKGSNHGTISGEKQILSQLSGQNTAATLDPLHLLEFQYPLLGYARRFWLPHTARFSPDLTPMWNLWKKLLPVENHLSIKPWFNDEGTLDGNYIIKLIFEDEHSSLSKCLDDFDLPLSTIQDLFSKAVEKHDFGIIEKTNIVYRAADVDIKRAFRATSREGHVAVVKLLLDRAADVDINGALYLASAGGHEAVVKLLVDRAKDIGIQDALCAASLGGHKAVVKLLLERAADVDMNRALRAASREGHEAVVKLLLGRAADKDIDNALCAASLGGYVAVVKLLLDRAVNVSISRALRVASREGHVAVVKLFLGRAADVDINRALRAASREGHVAVIKLFVD